MMCTPNGCMCHWLPRDARDRVCISCAARAKAENEGHTCQAERWDGKCGLGLLDGEERDRRMCTDCDQNGRSPASCDSGWRYRW
jgi:hypothetical protein